MIVVTGGTGRIGRAIQHVVMTENAPACAFQSRKPGHSSKTHWHQCPGNDAIQPAYPPDTNTILHLAGATPSTGADYSKQDYQKANCDLALSVLNAAKAASVKRVVIASSSSVYGRPDGSDLPLTEETPLVPLTDYAQSKVDMEMQVAQWREKHADGPEVVILRIGNIAGADQLLQNAMMTTPSAPLKLDQFPSGLGPLRSYIGPLTLARILLDICTHTQSLPSCINVAQAPAIRMEELLKALSKRCDVFWEHQDAPEAAIEKLVVDIGKLEKVFPNQIVAGSADGMIDEFFQIKTRQKER